MKPTVKSSLPTASILFPGLLLMLFLVQARLDSPNSVRRMDERPYLGESVFTSEGSLVHVVGIPDPPVEGLPAWHREVYDETLSAKIPSISPEVFHKEYQTKRISIAFVSEKGPDWWSRRVWRFGSSLLWWNGPEGQFDLYDSQTRLRMESIGLGGAVARAPSRPNGRFRLADKPILNGFIQRPDGALIPNGNGEAYCWLITDDGVLRLNPDPQNLSLEYLFHGKVEGWAGLGWLETDRKFGGAYLISGGAIWQLDLHGPPVRKISLSDQLAQAILASSNAIVPLENGRFSIQTQDPHNIYKKTLFLLDSDGHVLRRVEIDRDELNARIGGISSKSPTVHMPIVILPILPLRLSKMTTAAIIQYAILSLVLAALVTWHQARTGRRGWPAFAWSAFTFVAGLAGAVAYVIAHWDKRTEACPGCGRRRPIAQDTCPHCGIPWPKPAKSGFEVLEAH